MALNLHRVVAGSTVVVLLAAGCSGSNGDADPADTTAPATAESVATNSPATDPPVTDPPSTDPPPTDPPTTDPPPTEPPPTDPPTTDPPPTEPPSTEPPSTDPPSTPEGEVTAAIAFFEKQWKDCLRTLPDCDVEAAAERTRGDVNRETVSTAVAFNTNGYVAENVDGLEYRVDAVTVSADGTTATATVCVTDPVTIRSADGTPIDERVATSVEEYELQLRDDLWQWSTRTLVGEVGESEQDNKCE